MCVDFLAYPFVGTKITIYDGKNALTDGCVRGEASICSHITDEFVMHRVVKWEVLEFTRPRGTKNWILLGDLCQVFLDYLWCTRLKFYSSMLRKISKGRVSNCIRIFEER